MLHDFATYKMIGHRLVFGWLESEVLTVLELLNSLQRNSGISGSVAEIGVHHGKLFIGLHLLKKPAESSVAIDLFSDQQLNVDMSGGGDIDKFQANVGRWSSRAGLVVHQGDSTSLEPQVLLGLAGGPIRLFSVDGGHTEQTVLSDMRLAESTLAEGGVVIADDVFNPRWPGVCVGTLRYIDQGGALVPFMIGFNKVLFARSQYCCKYRSAIEAAFRHRRQVDVQSSVFAGHEVGVLLRGPRMPVRIVQAAARSELALSLYHHLVRRDKQFRDRC